MICWIHTSPIGLDDTLITPENRFIQELPPSVQSVFHGAELFGVIDLTIYNQISGLNISVAQGHVIEHGYYITHVPLQTVMKWPLTRNPLAVTMTAAEQSVAANTGLTMIRIQQVEAEFRQCLEHLQLDDVDEIWRELLYRNYSQRRLIIDAIMFRLAYAGIPADLPTVLDNFITLADQFKNRAFTYAEYRLDTHAGLNHANDLLQELHSIMNRSQDITGIMRCNLIRRASTTPLIMSPQSSAEVMADTSPSYA